MPRIWRCCEQRGWGPTKGDRCGAVQSLAREPLRPAFPPPPASVICPSGILQLPSPLASLKMMKCSLTRVCRERPGFSKGLQSCYGSERVGRER